MMMVWSLDCRAITRLFRDRGDTIKVWFPLYFQNELHR